MSAHTPGPWRATFRGYDQSADWSSRIPYAIERTLGASVQPIADICEQPESEANARLIAAAPELLAALQEVFLIGDRLVSDVYGHEFVEAARAAIAKATGEQP